MLLLLSDLNEVTTCAARDLDRRAPKVHGGARRTGPGAVAALVHQIIEIYDGVRERHPRKRAANWIRARAHQFHQGLPAGDPSRPGPNFGDHQ